MRAGPATGDLLDTLEQCGFEASAAAEVPSGVEHFIEYCLLDTAVGLDLGEVQPEARPWVRELAAARALPSGVLGPQYCAGRSVRWRLGAGRRWRSMLRAYVFPLVGAKGFDN